MMTKIRSAAARHDSEQSGEIMIEAMIVVVFTLFVLFTVLEMSFFLYQQVNMVITANDTAVRMAQTYRFPRSDYLIGFVEPIDITSTDPYRYMFGDGKEVFEKQTQRKSATLAQYRLMKTSLLAMKGESQTETEIISDARGRRHLKVTVTATYHVPMLAFLRWFKSNSNISPDCTYTMRAISVAECPDMIDYISTVNYTKHILNNPLKSSVVTAIDKIIKAVASIENTVNQVDDRDETN